MKLILAFIRPEKLAAVQAGLPAEDVRMMTVSEVLGCGRDLGSTEVYRGRRYSRPASRIRLEIAVDEPGVQATVEAIKRAGCSNVPGRSGDGEVLVMGLQQCEPIGADGRYTSAALAP
jgi:nitrogen regulatory protein P-II 1